MTVERVLLQNAYEAAAQPTFEQFELWVQAVASFMQYEGEVGIRIVENGESQQLNLDYRGKDKPTNILSFPFETPECVEQEVEFWGDLIIAADVVIQEAFEQKKAVNDHWAHLVVHGCLHLLGYDHIDDDEAEEMEQLERDILATLTIADPYLEG